MISAIPIPDPILERKKILLNYDPSIHNYGEEVPHLGDVGHEHLVFGSESELEAYKVKRQQMDQ